MRVLRSALLILAAAAAAPVARAQPPAECADLDADALTAKGEAFAQLVAQGGCALVPQAAAVGIDCNTDLGSSAVAQGFAPGVSGTLEEICPASCDACAPPSGPADGDAGEGAGDDASADVTNSTRLVHPEGEVTHAFGAAIALTEEHALVGSRHVDLEGAVTEAWVFERLPGGGFGEGAALVRAEPQAGERFGGDSLALDGGVALVGASHWDNGSDNDTGVVVAFELDPASGEWQQTAEIEPDDLSPYARFGQGGIALDNGTAVIGSLNSPCEGVAANETYLADITGDAPDGQRCGRAYVFERDPATSTWTQVAVLTASDQQTNDWFGFGTSIDGDTAVISSPGHAERRGTLYVFQRDAAGAWSETAKILHSRGDEGHRFGDRGAVISGNTIVAGSPLGTSGDLGIFGRQGEAIVYQRAGVDQHAWVELATLVAGDGDISDFFGVDVDASLDGAVALVGAPGADALLGAAYVFVRQCGEYTELAKLSDPEGNLNDQFGRTISVSAVNQSITALAGADNAVEDGVPGRGAAFAFEGLVRPVDPCADCEAREAELIVSVSARRAELAAEEASGAGPPLDIAGGTRIAQEGSEADDNFGREVSIFGPYALVGGWGSNDFNGGAWIFERADNGSWVETARLEHSDAAAEDRFGLYLAMGNGTAVVGAPRQDFEGGTAAENSGAVYIYERDAATGAWQETAKLEPEGLAPHAKFGNGVSIDADDTIVIGADAQPCPDVAFNATFHALYEVYDYDYDYPDPELAGQVCGAAYVYVRSPDTGGWELQSQLRPDVSVGGDAFGLGTAVDGDTALVSAPGHDNRRGTVYVFVREAQDNGTVTWRQQAKLLHSYGREDFAFSDYHAVALSGDTAVVGSAGANVAHIYQRIGEAWYEQATLAPAGGLPDGENFGIGASIDGDTAIVGALTDSDFNATGAAYVFRRSCGEWSQIARLTPAFGSDPSDQFGRDVSISMATAIVGAPKASKNGGDAHGAADIFDLQALVSADACATECSADDAALESGGVDGCEARVAELECVSDALSA